MSLSTDHYSHTFLQSSIPQMDDFIQRLLVPVPPVHPKTHCEEVYGIFARDRAIQSIAVVENDYPLGLVNRFALIDRFSRRYFRELYERKPIPSSWKKPP